MNEQTPQPVKLKFISFPGKIHLINDDQELAKAAARLEGVTQLGFDTETRPSFKKGEVYKVALVQLATDDDAYIIRMHGLTTFEPVKKIFENGEVLKVGVAVKEDIVKLQKSFRFEPKNFVELQELAKKKGLKNFGLKGMTEEVLNAGLTKGPKLTNWEMKTLSDQQLMYAATDAWIGLELYRKLKA